ncbi:hypothetical protein ALQ56_03985, partial [Pseudomonas syringae pv. papulans]
PPLSSRHFHRHRPTQRWLAVAFHLFVQAKEFTINRPAHVVIHHLEKIILIPFPVIQSAQNSLAYKNLFPFLICTTLLVCFLSCFVFYLSSFF